MTSVFSGRRRIIIAVMLINVLLIYALWTIRTSALTEPATTSDPLVTKSYVDSAVRPVDQKLQELEQKLQEVGSQDGSPAALKVVELDAGKKVLAGAGTEIILRAGSAKALKGTNGGISDTTAGKDLAEGANIEYNHLLISARDDGRGISITKKAWLLVRGTYTLK